MLNAVSICTSASIFHTWACSIWIDGKCAVKWAHSVLAIKWNIEDKRRKEIEDVERKESEKKRDNDFSFKTNDDAIGCVNSRGNREFHIIEVKQCWKMMLSFCIAAPYDTQIWISVENKLNYESTVFICRLSWAYFVAIQFWSWWNRCEYKATNARTREIARIFWSEQNASIVKIEWLQLPFVPYHSIHWMAL